VNPGPTQTLEAPKCLACVDDLVTLETRSSPQPICNRDLRSRIVTQNCKEGSTQESSLSVCSCRCFRRYLPLPSASDEGLLSFFRSGSGARRLRSCSRSFNCSGPHGIVVHAPQESRLEQPPSFTFGSPGHHQHCMRFTDRISSLIGESASVTQTISRASRQHS
jgi:hypothetical protein